MAQTEKFSIRLTENLRDLLTHEARRVDRSESYIVRKLIEAHFMKKVMHVNGLTKKGHNR